VGGILSVQVICWTFLFKKPTQNDYPTTPCHAQVVCVCSGLLHLAHIIAGFNGRLGHLLGIFIDETDPKYLSYHLVMPNKVFAPRAQDSGGYTECSGVYLAF